MTVKFDPVAHRARFNKDKPPKEYINAYRSGLDLEQTMKSAKRRKTDGELAADAKDKIDVRVRRFNDDFRALILNYFTVTSDIATKAENKNTERLKTLPRHQFGKKRLPEKAPKLKTLNYEIASLARFALTSEDRADKLQQIIVKAQENKNDKLIQACIAAGIDFNIREPLANLIDVMNKKDRARYFNEPKGKRTRVSTPKEKSDLEKDLDSLKKVIKRSDYDASVLVTFKTFEEKIKEEKPETQSRLYQKMAQFHPQEKERLYSQALTSASAMKDGAAKGKRFLALRNNAINEEFRMNAHDLAIKHMSFRDLASDAVDLHKKDIAKYAQERVTDTANYYAMNQKSQTEIDRRKETWTLDDQRLYESLKPMVLRPLMAGQ